MTHHLKLADNMFKYEMDPSSVVEGTEWAWFGLQTEGCMDSQMDEQSETGEPPQLCFPWMNKNIPKNSI